MPKKRLNITVDAAVIDRARRYSERHNASISRLVGESLARLPATEEQAASRLTATVKRLLGVVAGVPDREDYRRYLLEKHVS